MALSSPERGATGDAGEESAAGGVKEASYPDDTERRALEDVETAPRPRYLLSNYKQARSCVTSRRRAHTAMAGKCRRSPFVGYNDSREAWLMQERKWLREDEVYLLERKEDLRHTSLMKKLATTSASDQDLYEKRTFFGPHSVKLKAAKVSKGGKASVSPEGRNQVSGRKAGAGTEYRGAAITMRKLQQELETSQRGLSVSRPHGYDVHARSARVAFGSSPDKEPAASSQRVKDLQESLKDRISSGTLILDPGVLRDVARARGGATQAAA
mmetsp:Transcript_172314/g.419015  ORF Transcript_172314/g.419015 Transcript_172314/m.419015 type:complete len:270 (+) Transcript_172314:393-1202(+)